MKLDNMFKKTRRPSGKKRAIGGKHQSPEVPEGLLCKCNKCQKAIITEDVITGGYICPKCHGYFACRHRSGFGQLQMRIRSKSGTEELKIRTRLDIKGIRKRWKHKTNNWIR